MSNSPYQILGDAGVRALVDAFFDVMSQDNAFTELRALYPSDVTDVKQRLKAYLVAWMGGPPVYAIAFGDIDLKEAHAKVPIDANMRDCWLKCMALALDNVQADAELKTVLQEPLFRIAESVRNRGGPVGDDPSPPGMRVIARG